MIPSKDFVCKKVEDTYIQGERGEFYGIVSKLTNEPVGFGVFKTEDWLHCGEVREGMFQEGRRVSLNRSDKILKLTNSKFLADKSVLLKIERFSKQGVERYF